MRAFTVPEFRAPGAVTEQPRPTPGPGQILVRVHAAGVNPMDNVVVQGWAASFGEHRTPLVPGFDYAGEVEALGEGVTGLAVGDRVFGGVAKPVFGEGSWAEYVAATASVAHGMPDGVTFEQAAAIPVAGGTALALVEAATVSTGQTIAVVGAAGGVGSFAVQLAANAGARVIAATRPGNEAFVRDLGASDVVDATGDLVAQICGLAPHGLDALLDTFHDAPALAELAPAVRANGWIASPRGQGLDEALGGLPIRGASVSAALDRVGEIADLVATGKIRVPVEAVPLEEANRALAAIGSASIRGKQVLTID